MKSLPPSEATSTLLQKYAQGKRDFSGVRLNECTLSGAKLPQVILRAANLNVANLSSANLSQGDLQQALLNVSRLSGANLSQANLRQAQLNVANLIRAVLVGADLSGASLIRSEMLRADLSNANLTQANLQETDLREVRLRWANLNGTNLSHADARNSNLLGANLSNVQASSSNFEGANLSGASLMAAECRHANLRSANLSGVNLRGANLRWANLSGANLKDADLTDAKLSGADLTGAQLDHAVLENTTLVHADLSRANLRQARCVGTDFSGATLTAAQMHSAIAYDVRTAEIVCKWLDLSPLGDQSQRRYFNMGEDIHSFLNQRPAQVNIMVDGVLTMATLADFSNLLVELAKVSPVLAYPPNITLTNRHTQLTFIADSDVNLLAIAGLATWAFQDSETIHQSLAALAQAALKLAPPSFALEETNRELQQVLHQLQKSELAALKPASDTQPFFTQPLQIKLVNARGQVLELYTSDRFGTRTSSLNEEKMPIKFSQVSQPSLANYLAFLSAK
ncbi:MAG: pentapeptide repeat-containing protein [Leptolyngbyaceae cyanobacterium]